LYGTTFASLSLSRLTSFVWVTWQLYVDGTLALVADGDLDGIEDAVNSLTKADFERFLVFPGRYG
jgi:hypothetical protein